MTTIEKEIERLKKDQTKLYNKQRTLETKRENIKIKILLETKQLQSIPWKLNKNDVVCADFSIIPAIYKSEKNWDKVDSLCDTIYDISQFTFDIKRGVEVYLDYDDSELIISFKTFKQGIEFIITNKLKVDFSYIPDMIKDKEKELGKFKELLKKFQKLLK